MSVSSFGLMRVLGLLCLYLCLFTHAASSLTLMHGAPPSITERLEEKISHRKDGRQMDEGAEMKPGLGQPERGRGGCKSGSRGGNKWPEERLKIDSRTEQTEGSDSEIKINHTVSSTFCVEKISCTSQRLQTCSVLAAWLRFMNLHCVFTLGP